MNLNKNSHVPSHLSVSLIFFSISFFILTECSFAEVEINEKEIETISEVRAQLNNPERFTNAYHPQMLPRVSGELTTDRYDIVDLSGSVTRSVCPYTCEDRNLPEKHCKSWKSPSDPEKCYVRDTRIESDAFPSIDEDITLQKIVRPKTPRLHVVYHKKIFLGEGEQSDLVRKATQTIKSFREEISADSLAKAECIAIFPEVMRAAAVVGSRYGDGVATCRDRLGRWSALGFVDLVGASVGLQLGAEKSQLILFFNNENAKNRLESGKASLGTDLSIIAGSSALSKRPETELADVTYLAKSNGALASLSLGGVSIEADPEGLKEFYAENARFEYVIKAYEREKEPIIVEQLFKLIPAKTG